MSRPRELRALLRLARAQLTSRSARIRFRDTERSTAERTVDVLALAFDPPRWLVATWSPQRRSLRLLDLARVLRVEPTRRRAGAPPQDFEPIPFATRRFLDASGPPRPTTIRVEPPWTRVAAALLPTCSVEPIPGGALLHVRASHPEVVEALAKSLSALAAIDSTSSPWPKPERRRSLTRRASSALPPGSSSSPSQSPARRSTQRSRTNTAGSLTRPSGSSRGTRTR